MPRPSTYSTDLTEGEWMILAPLIPLAKPGGRPRSVDLRAVLEAVFYVVRSGMAWRLLPREFPKWKTVYGYFRRWCKDGTWERLHAALRGQARLAAGRQAHPTAAILDSQTAKTTPCGGPRGYDGGKKINGRKRHLLADTGGLVLKAFAHEADVRDPDAAPTLVAWASRHLPTVRHAWVDMGYRGAFLAWASNDMGWSMDVVRKPSRWGWYPIDVEPPPMPAFTVLPRRWVVERTFAWLGLNRRLSRDCERVPETTEAWIYVAMSRLMLRRLARNRTPQWALAKAA